MQWCAWWDSEEHLKALFPLEFVGAAHPACSEAFETPPGHTSLSLSTFENPSLDTNNSFENGI